MENLWEEGGVEAVRPKNPKASVPMNPVTTTMVQHVGTDRPNEVRQEYKMYTPEQARAMGKTMGPLCRESVVDWIARVGELTGMSADDVVALVRKGMSPEDYGALTGDVQLATIWDPIEIFKRLYEFYWPNASLTGRYYTEKQGPNERLERYILCKKALFRMAGANVLDIPEFWAELLKGLSPTLRITMGAVDPDAHTLAELETRIRAAFELHREAYPVREPQHRQPTRETKEFAFKKKPVKVAAVKETGKDKTGRAPGKPSPHLNEKTPYQTPEERERYEAKKHRNYMALLDQI